MSARLRTRLAVALAALAVVFGGLELGLRAFGWSAPAGPLRMRFANRLDVEAAGLEGVYRPSEELFWEPRPGAREPYGGDAIGARGLRGPQVADAPPPGTLRVALLGDSCTYGVMVGWPQTYGARLAAALGRPREGRFVEVVCAGVPGYSTFQSRRLFERTVRPLAPHVVVLYLGAWNDFSPALGLSDAQRAAGGAERPNADPLRFVQLARTLVARFAAERAWQRVVDAWLAGEPPDGYRVPLDAFERDVAAILDACERDGAHALVVLPALDPSREAEQPRNYARSERYREALRTLALARGVPLVDQRAVYAPGAPAELYLDIVHPSARGHAWLALALADAIERAGWPGDIAPAAPGPPPTLAADARALDRSRGGRVTLEVALGVMPGDTPGRALAGERCELRLSRTPTPFGPRGEPPLFPLMRDELTARALGSASGVSGRLAARLDEHGRARLELELAPDAPALAGVHVFALAVSVGDVPHALVPVTWTDVVWLRFDP